MEWTDLGGIGRAPAISTIEGNGHGSILRQRTHGPRHRGGAHFGALDVPAAGHRGAGTGTTAGVLYPGWTDTPIIRASHDDAVASELLKLGNPGILGRTVPPEHIAKAAVRGIERRSQRVISPRRWAPFFLNRGAFAMLTDTVLDKNTRAHELLRQL